MRFWISHVSDVPIREQLVTQIVLAILSEDLKAGARLPSTRELARRFRIHANTVSAAYKDLEKAGWLVLRHGSGVYIQEQSQQESLSPELGLDRLIGNLFRSARESGVPLSVVRKRLRHWLELQPPDHFLLIEPDAELARIVVAEIQQAVTFPVRASDLGAWNSPELQSAVPLAMPSKVASVRKKLPDGVDCIGLRVRSVTESMAPWMPARKQTLVAVVSGWPDFLKRARTMLVAAGFDSDGLLVRDARENGWEKGLTEAAAVICDSLTATRVPKECRAISFPLLAQASLAELRRYEDFIKQPLT